MGEQIPLNRAVLEQLGIDVEKFFAMSFEPMCWYNKGLDWFFYLSRDCSYVATRTDDPHVELLMDHDEVVGMKIMWFTDLPRDLRQKFMQATGVDPDDIKGIEYIWLHNIKEHLPEIEAAESAFFKELRWRSNRFRHEALYDSLSTTRVRHGRVMKHLQSLDPKRLPG